MLAWVPLLIVVWLGYQVATRLFGERNRWAAAALAPGLGILTWLTLLGLSLHQWPIGTASWLTFGVMALAATGLTWVGRRGEPLETPDTSVPCRIWLLLCTLIVLLYNHFFQISYYDGDLWVHVHVMSTLLKGCFPLHHPFFPELDLNGHYGRDMLLASLASVSGADIFVLEWASADVLQTIQVPIAFALLHAHLRREWPALLGTAFFFFGVNVGYHAGVMDMVQNMNPLSHLALLTVMYMVVSSLSSFAAPRLVVSGLFLGTMAGVEETYYGLLGLTTAALGLLLMLTEKRQLWLLAAATICLISLPVAMVEGGQLSYQVKKRLGLTPPEANLSRSEKVATQRLSIVFPKRELMQLYLLPHKPMRVSAAWQVLAPGAFPDRDDEGYAALWEPRTLKLFWLPVYLAPLVIFYLARRRNLPGLAWSAFGGLAILVPCLVNFGDYWEKEYFRWVGNGAIALAVALGMAAGLWRDSAQSRPGWLRAAFGIFICLNLLGAGNMVWELGRKQSHPTTPHRLWPDPILLTMEETRQWQANGGLQQILSPVDVEAARWLSTQTWGRTSTLRNFEPHPYYGAHVDALIGAMAGTYMLGHAVPSLEESGVPPYKVSDDAERFWTTGDISILHAMGVQWLYIDANRLPPEFVSNLLASAALHLGFDRTDSSGQRRLVFRVR